MTPWTVALQDPLGFPGKNTGLGSGSLLQGLFLTQRLNPGLLHFRQILYHLSHHIHTVLCSVAQTCLTFLDPLDCSPSGSSVHGMSQARILEWVAMPFSRGSSQPRDESVPLVSNTLKTNSLSTEQPGKLYSGYKLSSDTLFANIFSHFTEFLFTFLLISFNAKIKC